MSSQLKAALALCLVFGATTILTAKAEEETPTPTLIVDIDYVRPGEVNTFDCTGFTYDEKKTVVRFFFNQTLVYDSKTKKIEGKGITATNATQITVNGAEWGKEIVAPTCQVDAVISKPLRILPFIAALALTVNPKDFKVGTAFTVTCNVDVQPKDFLYSVIFYQAKNKVVRNFATWAKTPTVNNQTEWFFIHTTILPGATVASGTVNLTANDFSTIVTPADNDPTGDYYCHVSYNGNREWFSFVESNKWIAKDN